MRTSPPTPALSRRRVSLIGTTVLAVTALAGAVMAVPALATGAPSVTVTPDAIQTGQRTTISGTGFVPLDHADIYLDGPRGAQSTLLGSVNIAADGTFTANELVPRTTTLGSHTLTVEPYNAANAGTGVPGNDPFGRAGVYVNATGPGGAAHHPIITIGDLTTPGKGQTVTLWGFFPGETVDGGYGTGQTGGPTGQSAVADHNGTVTFTYVYPASMAKGWTGKATFSMVGIGAKSQVDSMASFTVIPNPPTVAAPKPSTPSSTAVPVAPVAVPVAGRAHFTG